MKLLTYPMYYLYQRNIMFKIGLTSPPTLLLQVPVINENPINPMRMDGTLTNVNDKGMGHH